MRSVFLRPWQQNKTLTIVTKDTHTSAKGRVNASGGVNVKGSVRGTIATASQREIDKWKQLGHPVTHQIVCEGTQPADAGDYFQAEGRNFYIHGKEDPGELGHFTIYTCEERNDVY